LYYIMFQSFGQGGFSAYIGHNSRLLESSRNGGQALAILDFNAY